MSKNYDEQVYAITNLEGYAQEMRLAAAHSFSDDCEEVDEYISLNQMINLIKSECIGFDDENRPLLNEQANTKIYDSAITWIQNVGLSKLAAKGLVECAWDNKTNTMIFWANEKTTNYRNISKIVDKTGESNDNSTKRKNKRKNKGS